MNDEWSKRLGDLDDDPFDAEWAALAARNNSSSRNSNPFLNGDSGLATTNGENNVKTFELQM